MSEKRFATKVNKKGHLQIIDREQHIYIRDSYKCVEIMNEQQAIIKHLTIEKHQADKRFQTIIAELKKENERLKEELNNLKKDETMLYHYYTLAKYGGDDV